MAELQFDATQYEPSEGRPGPIPEGWYTLMATKSNLGPTRDGTGARLTMTFTVQGGDHNGRTVIHGFNVRNQNEVAQRIGLEELSALCHAVNMLHIQNTEQLHNIPFKAKVKIEPAQMETDPSTGLLREKYAAKNEITTFKPMSFVIPDEPAGAAAPAPVAPVAPPAGMPPISQPAPPVQNPAAAPAQGFPPPGYPQPGTAVPAGVAGQPIQTATPPPHTHAAPVAPPAGAPPVQSAPPPVPTQVAQPWEQAAPPVAPQQAPTAPAATAPPAAPPDAAQQAAQVATPPWEQGAPAGTAPPSTPPWQQ